MRAFVKCRQPSKRIPEVCGNMSKKEEKDLIFTKNLSNARDRDENFTKFAINYKTISSNSLES